VSREWHPDKGKFDITRGLSHDSRLTIHDSRFKKQRFQTFYGPEPHPQFTVGQP